MAEVVKYSYSIRPVNQARKEIVGLYAEPEDSLDMIYIGASTAYRSWSPMKAWGKRGIASYTFSSQGSPASLQQNLLIESLKEQDPKLIILDLYPFVMRERGKEYTVDHIKNVSNAFKYSLNRANMIDSFQEYDLKSLTKEEVRYLKYDLFANNDAQHKVNKLSQKYKNNDVPCPSKGFRIRSPKVKPVHYSRNIDHIDDTIELSTETDIIFNELLDYIDKKKLNVLFTFAPMSMDIEKKKVVNTFEERVVAEGYVFFDSVDHYKKMGIDFATDFYNRIHMNTLGAHKYTDYLAEYIDARYDLPDRRSDEKYELWNRDYKMYTEVANKNTQDLKAIIIEHEREKT